MKRGHDILWVFGIDLYFKGSPIGKESEPFSRWYRTELERLDTRDNGPLKEAEEALL
jgi:hypothetical protein